MVFGEAVESNLSAKLEASRTVIASYGECSLSLPIVSNISLNMTFPDNIVLRIPILYGDVEYLDESAVTTLFKLLLNPPEKGKEERILTL